MCNTESYKFTVYRWNVSEWIHNLLQDSDLLTSMHLYPECHILTYSVRIGSPNMFIGTVGPDLGSATRLAPQSLGSMHSESVVGGILVVIPAGELVSPAFQTIYI